VSPGASRVENAEVARIFREVAELLDIQGANAFRIRAYRNAARAIEEWPAPIGPMARKQPAQLTDIPGIGADLAGKIGEIVKTGRLHLLAELARASPRGAVELLRVPGIGPRRARVLAEDAGVRTLEGLARAARAGRLRGLPGFGARSEQAILRHLAQPAALGDHRMLRATAVPYAQALVEHLRAVAPARAIEVAGSYRRRRDTVGDLDLLVASDTPKRVVERFTSYPGVVEVMARGATRAAIRLASGLQVDLRVLAPACWGAGLYYFTGSKAHNIAVRKLAAARGLKVNEYGVWRGARQVGGAREQDVFDAVGLPWIPPELREDRGEIEAAQAGTLPRLVEAKDLRGDLQCHSTDSDGHDTLETMARAAEERGYAYLAITDHSPSVRVAQGLDRRGFLAQMRRIDRLNAKLKTLTVLKGAEVDIHADGTLDLDDDTLAALDIVLVAIHSKFELPAREQTRRVVMALSHPSVDVFAHPTGRAIGRRAPVAFDLAAVVRAALEHGVMLEVNAQPERLDLDDVRCRAAIEGGARITIGSDAHSTDELALLPFGVDQARRGWARQADVANTRPLAGLLKLLHGGR